MFNEYPYTDYHELNTDWIISKIKNVETAEANTKQYAEDADAAKVAAEDAKDIAVQAKDDAVEAKDDAVEAKDDAISFLADTKDQLNLLQARVDNIIPDGTQTAGNLELLDIRVGNNGSIYDSAGDAVRGQVQLLQDQLDERIPYDTNDVLKYYSGWKEGYYYNKDAQQFEPLAARTCTDFIKCEPLSKWKCEKLFMLQFFDVNQDYLSNNVYVDSPTTVTFPNNAEYVIVTYLTANAGLWTFEPEHIIEECTSPLLRILPQNMGNTLVENAGKIMPSVAAAVRNVIYGDTNVSYHTKYSEKSKRIQLVKAAQSSIFSLRIDMIKMSDGIGVWFYVDETLRYGESGTNCTVRFSETSDYGLSGCHRYAFHLVNGWNFIKATPDVCTVEGTPSGDVRYLTFNFPQIVSAVNNGEVTASIFVDSVISGYRLKPCLAITYDAMWADTYNNNIYQYHISNSIPCNLALTDFDNTGADGPFNGDGVVTNEDLKDLALKMSNIYGFEMGTYGGYGNNAAAVRTGTDVDTVAELIHDNQNALNNELAYPCTFYACSQGIYNSVIENALKQCNIKVARMSEDKYIAGLDKDNIFVGMHPMYATDTAADAITWIDNMIAGGYCGVMFTHAVSTTPSTYQADYNEWKAMLDYVVSKVTSGELEVMNISQMVDMIKN